MKKKEDKAMILCITSVLVYKMRCFMRKDHEDLLVIKSLKERIHQIVGVDINPSTKKKKEMNS